MGAIRPAYTHCKASLAEGSEMRFQRIAIPAVLAAGLAALPVSAAKAQPYYPYPCHPFPLFWPLCAVGAIVGTAGAIVTAPFRGTFYPRSEERRVGKECRSRWRRCPRRAKM